MAAVSQIALFYNSDKYICGEYLLYVFNLFLYFSPDFCTRIYLPLPSKIYHLVLFQLIWKRHKGIIH